jgi:hypothetical protein
MPDYKKLYFALCRANAEAAELLLRSTALAEEELLREMPPPLRLGDTSAPKEPASEPQQKPSEPK